MRTFHLNGFLRLVTNVAAGVVAAAAMLATSTPSWATVWQLPFDPTGGSYGATYISGTLANPTTLDFILNLNALYTSAPTSSVTGDVIFSVFDNTYTSVFGAQTGGTAYAGDVGNVTTGGSTQPWLNTIIFPVTVNPGSLPILVLSLVDSLGGLTTTGGATINPILTVDLPSGLVASPGTPVSATPIPAALPMFALAMAFGVIWCVGWRRRIAQCQVTA